MITVSYRCKHSFHLRDLIQLTWLTVTNAQCSMYMVLQKKSATSLPRTVPDFFFAQLYPRCFQAMAAIVSFRTNKDNNNNNNNNTRTCTGTFGSLQRPPAFTVLLLLFYQSSDSTSRAQQQRAEVVANSRLKRQRTQHFVRTQQRHQQQLPQRQQQQHRGYSWPWAHHSFFSKDFTTL